MATSSTMISCYHSKAAQTLYHEFAEREPILDYHPTFPHRTSPQIANLRISATSACRRPLQMAAMRATASRNVSARETRRLLKNFSRGRVLFPAPCEIPSFTGRILSLKRYFGVSELLSEPTRNPSGDHANSHRRSASFRPWNPAQIWSARCLHHRRSCDDLSESQRHTTGNLSASASFRLFGRTKPFALTSHRRFFPGSNAFAPQATSRFKVF